MKTKLLLPLITLSLLALTIPQVQAQDTEPFVLNHEVNTYIETKIVTSYTFTQNVTSDAYSAGQSVWQVNVDPLTTSFITSAADKFTWHLVVSYGTIVDQDITIAVFSGNEPVDSLVLHIQTDRIILNFDISVTKQPKYPTAEELADMSIEVLGNQLQEYVAEMRQQNEISRMNMATQWVVVLIVFGGFIATLLMKYVQTRPKEEE